MHTTDRQRILRSAGMAVAALLLVGGAVFGSQAALSGGSDDSADELQNQSFDASEAEDASESPDGSPEQHEDQDSDADDDASESPDGSPEESDDADEADDDASESPDGSPDESDHSGPGGAVDHSDD